MLQVCAWNKIKWKYISKGPDQEVLIAVSNYENVCYESHEST